MRPIRSGNRCSAVLLVGLFALSPGATHAQTIDDGLLMSRKALGAGVLYGHDSWDQYWEGGLKRSNGNIGTLTTQTATWMTGYGVTGRLSVLAMLPYVTTHATQGTFRGFSGVQDLTLAAKYKFFSTPFAEHGTLSAFALGAVAMPATNYTPDMQPLSIGSSSRRASGRLTLNMQSDSWWFATATGAYTWRENVRLDRAAYYTDGHLFLTNEVEMHPVTDYTASAGYRRGRLYVPVSVTRQRTLGGGDIRRQDMPFVSNRMDFVKLDGFVMYGLKVPNNMAIRVGTTRTLSGRNVGQSTTLNGGVFYTYQH